MSDKYSPPESIDRELDGSLGENPAYPARKRPSDWGAGRAIEPLPPAVERAPTDASRE
jgi:hypothetical protein